MYMDVCYRPYQDPKSWMDSLKFCKGINADLVSIGNVGEMSWVTSLLVQNSGSGFWIGLHYSSPAFKWSDGSDLRIVHWSSKMRRKVPRDGVDCGYIESNHQEDPGYWSLSECEVKKPFVCETRQTQSIGRTSSVTGCSQQMIGWRNACYWILDRPLSVGDASRECLKDGGHIIDFEDVPELYFMTSIVYQTKLRYWTGLHQNNTIGWLQWSSGKPLILSTRQIGLLTTDFKSGNCAYFAISGERHRMDMANCRHKLPTICEKLKHGYSTPIYDVTTELTSPCSLDWHYSSAVDKCFWKSSTSQLTWQDAEAFCEKYDGNLVTLETRTKEMTIVGYTRGKMDRFWIGLKFTKDVDGSLKGLWSDGRNVSGPKWSVNSLHQYGSLRESCVYARPKNIFLVSRGSLSPSYSHMFNCASRMRFVCEKDTFGPISAVPFVVQSSLVPCPDGARGWFMFNGFCYYVAHDAKRTWPKAAEHCGDNQANLLSIHSDSDVDFVFKLLHLSNISSSTTHFWIGFNSVDPQAPYSWNDGSAANYFQWGKGQPSKTLSMQTCVRLSRDTGFWSVVRCLVRYSHICKRVLLRTSTKLAITNTTIEPSVDGTCMPGWAPVGIKCFKLFLDQANWNQALTNCRNLGPTFDLAAVHDDRENNLLKLLMRRNRVHAWIGLNDQETEDQFFWSDQSEVTFTDWDYNEPGRDVLGNSDCVFLTSPTSTFRWTAMTCRYNAAYLCQTYKDYNVRQPVGNSKNCTMGNSIKVGSDCYQLVTDKALSWDAAQKACEAIHGNLASVRNESELFILHDVFEKLKLNHRYVWIGLSHTRARQPFSWSDGWPIKVTNWMNDGALNWNAKCAVTDQKLFWKLYPCKSEMNFICKVSQELPPRISTSGNKVCPNVEGQWMDLGGDYCYEFEPSTFSWPSANFRCTSKGANLVSIHSMTTLESLSEFFGFAVQRRMNNPRNIWIGMFKSNGGMVWSDGTPVDFVRWDPTGGDIFNRNDNEECVALDVQTSNWFIQSCYSNNHYVCAIEKVVAEGNSSESVAPVANANSKSGHQLWPIVGYVVSAVCACLVLALVVFLCRKFVKSENRVTLSFRRALPRRMFASEVDHGDGNL